MPTSTELPEVDRSVLYIQMLADSFHSLDGLPHIQPWQPDMLDAFAAKAGLCHAEKLCVRFLLHVWNSTVKWRVGRFDPIEAYHCWDAQNWSAFVAWVNKPHTP